MRCIIWIFVFASYFSCVHPSKDRKKSKHRIVIEEIVKCPNNGDFSMNITQLGRGLQSLDLFASYPRRLDNLSFVGKIWQCPWETRNNCEMVLRVPLDDMCAVLRTPSVWVSQLKKITPDYKCPLEGVYVGKNVILDSEEIYHWFAGTMGEEILSVIFSWIDIAIYEEPSKEKILCLSVSVRLVSVRE